MDKTAIEMNNNKDDVDSLNVIPVVLMFKDIGFLEQDKMSQLTMMSLKLWTKLIAYGASALQNAEDLFAVENGHSITTTWFKCKLANEKEAN